VFGVYLDYKMKMQAKEMLRKPVPVVLPTGEQDQYPSDTKSFYELTLTSTVDDPYALRQWLKQVCDSKMFGVLKFKACMELTKAGMPHIHAILYSSKEYLNTNHIKDKLKFPYRFELAKVRSVKAFLEYISKSKMNDIDYCDSKGIPQTWSDWDWVQRKVDN